MIKLMIILSQYHTKVWWWAKSYWFIKSTTHGFEEKLYVYMFAFISILHSMKFCGDKNLMQIRINLVSDQTWIIPVMAPGCGKCVSPCLHSTRFIFSNIICTLHVDVRKQAADTLTVGFLVTWKYFWQKLGPIML